MTEIANQSPTPLLEILKKFETRMSNHASNPDVKIGLLQMEIGGFRSQLEKIFGADHPTLALFPKLISGSVPAHEAHQLAVSKCAQVQAIVRNVDELLQPQKTQSNRIFIGHGRSHVWRELKDLIQDRLWLPWDEFNSDSTAGLHTSERLDEMLDRAGFAFLIMTAEDELVDGTPQARPNVIHEIGLFQGRLGRRRAIILLEEGCSEFTNIVGLTQIRFPAGRISACFEDVRGVLEREGVQQWSTKHTEGK